MEDALLNALDSVSPGAFRNLYYGHIEKNVLTAAQQRWRVTQVSNEEKIANQAKWMSSHSAGAQSVTSGLTNTPTPRSKAKEIQHAINQYELFVNSHENTTFTSNFFKTMGIPCRHTIKDHLSTNLKLKASQFAAFWHFTKP